jgi:hypothetical protein
LEESDKMKKIIYILTSLIMLIAFTSCDEDEEYISPTEQAENNIEIIIKAINENNTLMIKEMLSEDVISDCSDIDSRLDKMLEFVDGEIVSYDEPVGSACGSIEKKDTGAKIKSLTTNKGTEYYIAIKEWYSYDEAPEQVGVYNITIKNLSELALDSESTEAIFRLLNSSN